MSQVTRTTFTVATSAGPLACTRWGNPDSSRPTALLVHGTGFCASVWNTVATDLADDFDVVAIDRRGHGASAKPHDAYDLVDFADDICDLADALGLDGAYGIGHSAGGTDLLLAAPRRPDAFARLLLIEPTVMDPDQPTHDVAPPPDPSSDPRPARLPSRRATFPSRQAAFDWLDGRGIFAGWQPDLFDAYITDGFEILGDGHECIGHAAPQVAPERIASLARGFWDPTGEASPRPTRPSARAPLQ